jgi:HME family heavy-metal exporter
MLKKLIAFSLHYAPLVLILAVALLLFTAYQVRHMPVDVFPELNAPTVVILCEAGGLAADEVEQNVTFPIETALNGMSGIRRVRTSSAVSLAVVYAEFDWGTDIYRARQVITERLATAQERLPKGVHLEIAPITGITGEIMLLALANDDDPSTPPVSELDLRAHAEFVVANRLLAVAGVAQVVAIGGELPEYQVNVRQEQLLLYGLSIEDVVTAAGKAHSTEPAGYLPNIEGLELPIRQSARVKSVEDIKNTVVKFHNGAPLTIGQVADVVLAGSPKRGTASESGRPAVVLGVQKAPATNTITITADIDEAIKGIQAALPRGITINPTVMRQADFINRSLGNVKHVLRDATIFVTIVLILFLMNVRTTVITLTALPLSLAITLLVMYAMDLSINVMTLGGLAVAIGVLVDDAIIDVENVYRRLREDAALPAGLRRPFLRVVYDASNEIRSAMVFATVIIVIVFIPLLFLQGLEGRFFRPLGITYVTSILASLAVALTVTPAMCRMMLKQKASKIASNPPPSQGGARGGSSEQAEAAATSPQAEIDSLSQSDNPTRPQHLPKREGTKCDPTSNTADAGHHNDSHVVRWLKALYSPTLRLAVGWRKSVLAAAVLITIASILLAATFGTSFLPTFNEGTISVFLNAPPGTSLEESNRLAESVDRQLMAVEGVAHVVRRTGRAERDAHAEPPSRSETEVRLKEGYRREEVLPAIDKVLGAIPGIQTETGQPIEHRLSHVLSGTAAAIAINVYGEDIEKLRVIAQEVEAELKRIPGTRDVAGNREALIVSLPIRYRSDDLKRFGLTHADAAEQVNHAYFGATVAEVNEGVRRYDIVVRLDPSERQSIADVRSLLLRGDGGAMVRLDEVADVGREYTPMGIQRENARRKAVISTNVAEGFNLGHLVEEVRRRIDPIVVGKHGYQVTYGGQFEAQQAASRTIYIMGGGVSIIILLLLYMAFHSIRAAMLVMVNLPLALVGGIAAIFINESPSLISNALALVGLGSAAYRAPVISIASMVGFVTLFGIAVRNGILLVDHYGALVREGRTLEDAVHQGSMERLVPILMTALCAVLGLVPLALAAGEPGSELLAPLAVVVLGGLVTSTMLNLVVVPAGYYLIFKNRPLIAPGASERVVLD